MSDAAPCVYCGGSAGVVALAGDEFATYTEHHRRDCPLYRVVMPVAERVTEVGAVVEAK